MNAFVYKLSETDKMIISHSDVFRGKKSQEIQFTVISDTEKHEIIVFFAIYLFDYLLNCVT